VQHVAIYARASLDRDEKRISVDRQVARCEQLVAERFSNQPTKVFVDNSLSGSDPELHRPGYEALLAAIRTDQVGQVVVHEQSRLTRLPAVWDELVVALTRAGIEQVHTVQQGTIPVAPGGRLLGRILAVVDAEESERIRLRAKAHAEHLASEGRPNGGRYYGYRRVIGPDGRSALEIYEPEAAVVRRIVDELLKGRSGYQIAEALNGDRVPTGKGGRRWWGQAVLAIARAPHIAGLRKHHGQVVGEGTWRPIVARDRWELLQSAIGTDPHRGQPWKPRRWLLTGGLAVCGACGAPMYTNKQPRASGNIDAYVCSPRAKPATSACGKVSLSPAQLVEDIVVGAALDALESPDLAEALTGDDGGIRSEIVERLAAAEYRVARAAEMFGAGEIDEVTWRRMHGPAAAAVDIARVELGALAGPSVDLPPFDRLRASWGSLTVLQQRQAIATVVEKVVVAPRTGRRPADHEERIRERLSITWRL
jgi:DNA invertase Pin-like site-specific DNA recombinase